MTLGKPSDEAVAEARILGLFDELLSLDDAARDAWLRRYAEQRPVEAARLRMLLTADASTNNALATGGAMEASLPLALPERIGAYRITALIGRGGMGAVYLGERATGDFDHRVAIKVIRPGPLSDMFVARFRNERRILAGLDHPNIARLFDGGETPQGEPYLVMEYIEGSTLRDLMESGGKTCAQLVAIFGQVCSAVQYAHQNLIVHGDITPANVLVDHDANTAKLIDFGIAHVSIAEVPSGIQDAHRAAYTRAYAAPERTSGEPASIASDVFGLGALLLDIIKAFPGADAELMAIAEKASRAEIDERYGSVAELLADLGRRDAGFPVLAMPRGAAYRLRKLVRRHHALFGSIAVGFVGLLCALVITLVLYRRAEVARQSEAERFAQVRSLARYQLFDLYEAVANLPRSTPVREEMVREAQRYLEELRLLGNASPGLVIETAEGFRRLGDIQGGPGVANIGNKEAARTSYARSLAMLDGIMPEARSTEAWKLGRARVLLSKARSDFFNDFEPKRAVAGATGAVALLRDRFSSPTTAATRAIATAALGEYLLYSGENDRASRQMRAAETAFAALDVAMLPGPTGEEVRVRRAANYRNEALALIELKRPIEALHALQGGDAFWDTMRRQAPDNRRYMRSQSVHLMQLGSLQGQLGRPAAAQAAYAEAEALARQNLSLDPADEAARFAVESISAERAHYLGTIGHTREALALLDPILRRRRALAASTPDDAKRAVDVLVMLRPFGDVYKAAGSHVQACNAYASAKRAFDAFARQHGMPDEMRNTEYADLIEAARSCSAV